MQFWDAVIFDLDGTLWNPADGILKAWNRGFTAHGLTPFITRSHVEHWMGMLLPDIAAYILPDMDEGERIKIVMDCVQLENEYLSRHGGALYPGVPETLEQLAGEVPLAIVSNCEDGYIEGFFATHHLGEYFADYEHPGRTGLDKAGNIRMIMERNKWRRPVYIGDTQIDYDAAQIVGIPFIHANYGFGRLDGVVQMNRFSELPQHLLRLMPREHLSRGISPKRLNPPNKLEVIFALFF